jgi:hypothetical protein
MAPHWGSATADVHYGHAVSAPLLRELLLNLEEWIPLAEASLESGRRITEPDRPMTPRGVRRRQTELRIARETLVKARYQLAMLEHGEVWLRRQLEGLGD